MKKENFIIVGITMIIVTISVSLAYFAAKIIGTPKDIDLAMKDLYVEFTDNTAELNASGITPGWTYEKTFTIENKSESEYKYNIIIKDLVNTFVTNNLQYKITNTSSNGGYSMGDFENITKSETKIEEILAYNVSISSGVKQVYKLELRYLDSDEQNSDMGKKFSGKLFITEGTEEPVTLLSQMLADKTTRPGARTSFSSVLTTDNTKTLYTGTEDGTTVYYFAGNATDNWVKFGKNESNQDLYWRIIRTNSDGSIRLLYHGTSTTATDAVINTSTKFNETRNDPMYVGYMYGTSGSLVNNRTNINNSTIKTTIDNWYTSNLEAKGYTKYLSTTAVYCNDRSNPASGYNTGNTSFNYGAGTRLDTNKTPTYDCTDTNDKFTVDTSTGNGKLTYPIALMTADEVSFAGGVYRTKAETWYYYNSAKGSSTGSTWWWLLSSYRWNGSYAYVFGVGGSSIPGRLDDRDVNYTNGVRPAISLKSCIKYSTGNGSASDPYTINLDPDISC